MRKQEIMEINEDDKLSINKADDFLILWVSPETRCLASLEKITNYYEVIEIIIFHYSNHKDIEREKNLDQIIKLIEGKFNYRIEPIDENSPIFVYEKIIEELVLTKRKNSEINITLDFSCPIKWHLLLFLRFLDFSKILNDVKFIYTEPEDYIINLFQPLSFGLKRIFPIPFFYGSYDFSKKNLLVIFLGYEGNRAVSIYENIDPEETILLIAKPAYNPDWEGRTEKLNRELINRIGEERINYIDAKNPISISQNLKKILSIFKSDQYNTIIAPLGTKPQLLGLYLYYRENQKNTMIMYHTPMRHNHLFYSEGKGKTWLFNLKFNEIQ